MNGLGDVGIANKITGAGSMGRVGKESRYEQVRL